MPDINRRVTDLEFIVRNNDLIIHKLHKELIKLQRRISKQEDWIKHEEKRKILDADNGGV